MTCAGGPRDRVGWRCPECDHRQAGTTPPACDECARQGRWVVMVRMVQVRA